MVKRSTRLQHGDGFFGDVWSGLKSIGSFVKDNKLISKGLALSGNPMLSAGANMFGVGRHKAKRKAKKTKSQGGKGRKTKKLVS